jgi:hypothetical protein
MSYNREPGEWNIYNIFLNHYKNEKNFYIVVFWDYDTV